MKGAVIDPDIIDNSLGWFASRAMRPHAQRGSFFGKCSSYACYFAVLCALNLNINSSTHVITRKDVTDA